jgi:hydrogenase maturation protease
MTSATELPPGIDAPERLRPIVIGVGNRDRGDDAAGPLVCDRLRARRGTATPIRTAVCEGSILDLSLQWESADVVIVVDAVQPGTEPGRIVTVDATAEALPTPGAVSTHEIDVSVAIELARAIDRMPARLLVIGIEAAHTEWGAPPSPAVDTAIDAVVELVEHLVADGDDSGTTEPGDA